MIFALLAATAAASLPAQKAEPSHVVIEQAQHALRAGRIDQAKLMIERAIASGAAGANLDRSLADLAYASGKDTEALARYEALLKDAPSDQALLEPAAIAALKLGHVQRAFSLLSRATSEPGASWRAWNAMGVVADSRSDWTLADRCYEKAATLAAHEPGPVNNFGWSLLLRGHWKGAVAAFEMAVAMDPRNVRASDNLELARSALAADLPLRRAGESAASWAARLNDAGVAAAILGEKERATAAFSRALHVSDTWYPRAADNLQALAGR
jgi:tetratricopeptide (TPR) repeat protein